MLVLAACSNATDDPASDGDPSVSSTDGSGGMGEGSFAFGEPGEPDAADRTVRISALDAFRFDPEQVSVAMGETILFEVTNEGELQHEFVIGDEAFQDEHEMEMAGMGDMVMVADEANAFLLEPGETKTLAWTFTVPGTFLYGCHVPGHYSAGMVGSITVSS
jgi:uncharacterized cupredoxin-like copper-binding protein